MNMLYGNPNADLLMMLDTTPSLVNPYSSLAAAAPPPVMEVGAAGSSCWFNQHDLQRSVDSHALEEEKSTRRTAWTPPYSNTNSHDQEMMSSSTSTMDHQYEISGVRRVFSAGDLHQHEYWNDGEKLMMTMMRKRAESPSMSTSESCSSIIESMSKACKYSPLEKQQRILRYRTKRNLRNFTKKIKYECRKTLADSRPRIRGRFARNDHDDHILQTNNTNTSWSTSVNDGSYSTGQQNHLQQQQQYDHDDDDYDDDDDENYWVNFLNSSSSSGYP